MIKKRGRRSGASLSLVPTELADVMDRVAPPSNLSADHREIWHRIVEAHPADWFDAGSVPLLAQLCRHIVVCDRLAELMDGSITKEQWLYFLDEQRKESAVVRHLSASLRLTVASLKNQRGNKTRNPDAEAPWNFK